MANDTPTDKDLIEHIANQIDQIARSIYTEHSEWLEATEEANARNTDLVNKRLKLCSDIARVADEGDWNDEHIKSAVSMAVARIKGNSPGDDKTSKAMQVFVSQVTLAAHEKVRNQFDNLTDVLGKAWAAEQEQAKKDKKEGRDIDTPIKKFVSRPYELVLRACREIIKPGEYGRKLDDATDRLVLVHVPQVEAWARANDPDMDADKVASKLETMIKQLKAMASIFADTDQHDLYQAASTLAPWVGKGDTKGTKLRMSKAKADAARNATQAKPETPTPTPTPTPEVITPVATSEAVATEEYTPLEGVFSVDATLNDALDRLAA